MYSLSPPSLLTIPFKPKRKSSSASTSASADNHIHGFGDVAPRSAPLPSTLSSLAPLHLTRRNSEWQTGDYRDGLDGVVYDQQDKVEHTTCSWSHRTHPLPYAYPPLPSLITKFTPHALRNDPPISYGSSPFPFVPQTTYFYPQGDSAIADDCEEYDLESMNIHIRETYFATSAERGHWLSSPIAPRSQSEVVLPMRGHSSPIKILPDVSPLKEHLRRHKISRSVDEQNVTSPSQDRDEDLRCSSPLPPSSPLSSPMSNLSFLNDDYEVNFTVDLCPKSDDCQSFFGTPELSISSTPCTSPVEPTCTSSPHEEAASIPTHQSTDPACDPTGTVSLHTGSCSPNPIEVHVHGSDATNFESDVILSPLSQFELDLPEAELPKLPLSDTVNKPQHSASHGVSIDVSRNQGGPSSIHSLSINANGGPLDLSLETLAGSGSNKKVKKRVSATGNAGTRRTRKCGVARSGSPSFDTKKKRGSQSRSSNHSEPPSKKSKLSHRRDDLESRITNVKHDKVSKIKRCSPSPTRPAAEGCDPEPPCLRDKKTPKITRRAQLQQLIPNPSTVPLSIDAVDVEFHASLTGMLIEALATSRATCMDASALYLVLTQAHPCLAAERSKEELLVDITVVLEAGRTRCGMFEKVDCSGERSRHKALEGRWFYVPERDEDPERASLISTIMPRQKRNETKKYKQYYYRPLDKISRWDPEDAP